MGINNNKSQAQAEGFERRNVVGEVELRSEGDGPKELFGYALKWGVSYRVAWFTEEIEKGALDNADLSDVRILFNHNPDLIIGRTKSGTASVGVDDTGLWFRSSIPDSPAGQNLAAALARGDVDQSSWAFAIERDETGRVTGDSWSVRNGVEHRVVKKVTKVFDASPVTYPANPDTSVAKRSNEEFKKQQEGENQQDKGIADTYDKLRRTLDIKAAIQQRKQ